MQSAAEAECGALYMNAKEAVPMRITIEELGHPQPGTPMRTTLEELKHPQPPTPMRTDNSTADGIMNKTVKQKASKSMDMRFYWVQDRVEKKQLKVFWAPGEINLADYQSKVQPTSVHRALRPIYLYEEGKSPATLQGCDEILKSLASGARKPVTSKYSNTTAQLGSYHQASLTHSNQLNINHSLARIAYE